MIWIRRIILENYGPIKNLDATLYPTVNYIIGANGSGKTTLMRLLALIAGPEKYEDSIPHFVDFGRIYIEVVENDTLHQFEAIKHLDKNKIDELKAKLSTRLSYASQDDRSMISGKTNRDTLKNLLNAYDGRENLRGNIFYNEGESLSLRLGGGSTTYCELCYLMALEDTCLMLDLYDRSLHIQSLNRLSYQMKQQVGQTLIATHNPEYMHDGEKIIALS